MAHSADRSNPRSSPTPHRVEPVSGGASATYSYDQVGELTGATPGTGAGSTYAYNGDGLRMTKTIGSTNEAFTWDTSRSTPQILVDGSTNFIYGPDGSLMEQEDNSASGNPTFALHDALGSTRALLDASGNLVGSYAYNAYGAIQSHTGTATTPIGFRRRLCGLRDGLQLPGAPLLRPGNRPVLDDRPGDSDHWPAVLLWERRSGE